MNTANACAVHPGDDRPKPDKIGQNRTKSEIVYISRQNLLTPCKNLKDFCMEFFYARILERSLRKDAGGPAVSCVPPVRQLLHRRYRSLDDFRSLLDWVKREADKEDGIAPYRARRVARNGGRG